MSAVGCRESDKKYDNGYQYQYCVNSMSPMQLVRRK